MKTILFYASFILVLASSCKKTRTCECTIINSTKSTATPRNGSPVKVENSEGSLNIKNTRPGLSNVTMRRSYNCNSRTTTSTTAYTVSAVYDSTGTSIADVVEVNTMIYDCTIK